MEYRVFKDIEVRFSDVDLLGHVNNASYLRYMEEVRMEYMEKFMPDSIIKKDIPEVPFVLGDVYCRFFKPAFFRQVLRIFTGVTQIGKKSLVMSYSIIEKQSQQQVAEGSSTLVMFDPKTKTTFAISDEIRRQFEVIEGRPIPQKTA